MTDKKSKLKGAPDAKFRAVAIEYLEAIKNRDHAVCLKHLSPRWMPHGIFPDGRMIKDYAAFVESQKFWFKGTTGSWNYEIDHLKFYGPVGLVAVIADYRNRDEKDVPFYLRLYICFLFEKQGEDWFMIHVQNTILKKE